MVVIQRWCVGLVLGVLLAGWDGEDPVGEGVTGSATAPRAVLLVPSDMGIVRAYMSSVSDREKVPLRQLWPGVWTGESPTPGTQVRILTVREGAIRDEAWTTEVRSWPKDARVDLSKIDGPGEWGPWERTHGETEPVWICWRPESDDAHRIYGVNMVAQWFAIRHYVFPMQIGPDRSWLVRAVKGVETRPSEMTAEFVIQETGPSRRFEMTFDQLDVELNYESQ